MGAVATTAIAPEPSLDASKSIPAVDAAQFPIAIIGAGFSGLGMAIHLKKAGILSFTIFERAGEIGGTWRDNTYPGAACDVPSPVYSYSFEQNPDWSSKFAGSREIQDYLLRCVDRYRLRPHLRLNTSITDARFDEERGVWVLTTDQGDTVTARAVVSGMGGLTEPSYPDIKGIGDFAGKIIHTARWDHDYDLAGKKVGVIGTGASAIQVIPAIAPEVGKLSVFQRTPAWVLPKGASAIDQASKDRYRRSPLRLRLRRAFFYWFSELMGPMIMLDSPRLSRIAERVSEKHLEDSVADPVLREKLRPDFQFGCKRILVSDDYWSTLERENVELFTGGIEEIRPGGVVTTDGREHALDALVLATGFEVGFSKSPFPVTGRGGRSLDDMWSEGATAYKGMTVSGVPNWFILMGPNTGPGHTSVLVYTEAQMGYILQALKMMIGDDVKTLAVRKAVQDRYNEGLQRRMKHTVWSSGCNSWYLTDDGKNHTLYPGFASEYRARVRKFRARDYDVSYLAAAS